MEKEKVEVLVRNLMEKLHIRNSDLDDIMRCYSTDSHTMPTFMNEPDVIDDLLGQEGAEEDNNEEIPESAQRVYFPWTDVIGSMMEYPEKVHYVETVCPDCGEKLLSLEFWSPHWTWRALCGRSGPMLICTNCPRQDSFCLHLMN